MVDCLPQKKDGTKSIFIPAAGGAWVGSGQVSGDDGYVWSSVLSTGYVDSGQLLGFNSGNVFLSSGGSYNGLAVRGVVG